MASPAPSTRSSQSASTRNPRRKRHDSEEGASVRAQQPQRKRSKLSNDLFSPQANGRVNGDAIEIKVNGHPLTGHGERPSSVHVQDIPYRSSPAQKVPQTRDDGVITLTKNDNYTIQQLPHLPHQIANEKRGDFRGTRVGRNGYALALTRDHAIVWDYTNSSHSTTTQAFPLSHPAKANEPLPVGALVTAGSARETGLVVIHAGNGKISFWENIENANALNLFERRQNGAQGSCGGLLSGETVTDIEDVGSAGFVLSFSSGRAAQLLLRDAQSRPMVSVQFLRWRASSGGFFGGLKSVFGGANLKTIAAVRHRPLHLREREEVILGKEDASFQFWQLGWSGQPLMARELDVYAAVEGAVLPTLPPETPPQNLKVVDFAIASDDEEGSDLLLLINYSAQGTSHFAMVEVDIDLESASPRRVIKLHSYTDPASSQSTWSPRLCLPSAKHMAIILFEKAISIVSLSLVSPSPEAQFLMDSGQLPEPFQDTVYFRDSADFSVCGVSKEEISSSDQPASVIAFIKSFGLVRIIAEKTASDNEPASTKASAKAKIEQAVFFGSMSSNPLNLTRKADHPFSVEDIEEAALQISHEILATESPYIVPVAVSMAEHIEMRARNVRDLAVHTLSLSSNISRATRWRLRSDGERLAAAAKAWALYDVLLHSRWREDRMLSETLVIMKEESRTLLNREKGERDLVRLWCTKDIWRMENIFEGVFNALAVLKRDDMIRDEEKALSLTSEAHDIYIDGLEAAFKFRGDNAALYGVESEAVRDGILEDRNAYAELPEPWTSSMRSLVLAREHFNELRIVLVEVLQNVQDFDSIPDIVKKLAMDCPRLVATLCRGAEETTRWHWSQSGQESQRNAEKYQIFYNKVRTDMIVDLVHLDMDLTEEASEIAEHYKDMPALVKIVSIQSANAISMLKNAKTDGDREEAANMEREMAARIRRYFDIFGHRWGKAMYSGNIRNGTLSTMLNTAKENKKELTQFLQAEPVRAKVSWINDVISERDYKRAAGCLRFAATVQEEKLWSKKVELSIAKLALLSTDGIEADDNEPKEALEFDKGSMQLVRIQERIYEHVRPFLYDAVDQSAELQLAMETFGVEMTNSTPALANLLEQGLASIIEHRTIPPEQLIDVLTLMDRRECPVKEQDISKEQTSLALSALKSARPWKDRKQFELLLRLIWKRCFITENWKAINDTSKKVDEDAVADLQSTVLFKTIRDGHTNELWEGASGIRLLLASQCIGAGASTDDYLPRFNNSDIRQRIAQDVSQQDAKLQKYMDELQLESWIAATKDAADRQFEADEEMEKVGATKVGKVMHTVRAERWIR